MSTAENQHIWQSTGILKQYLKDLGFCDPGCSCMSPKQLKATAFSHHLIIIRFRLFISQKKKLNWGQGCLYSANNYWQSHTRPHKTSLLRRYNPLHANAGGLIHLLWTLLYLKTVTSVRWERTKTMTQCKIISFSVNEKQIKRSCIWITNIQLETAHSSVGEPTLNDQRRLIYFNDIIPNKNS